MAAGLRLLTVKHLFCGLKARVDCILFSVQLLWLYPACLMFFDGQILFAQCGFWLSFYADQPIMFEDEGAR
jgi:hypothetical protein